MTVQPSPHWGSPEVAAHLGVPSHWVARLHEVRLLPVRAGYCDGEPLWLAEDVRVWTRREQALSATMPVRREDLRLLASAMRPIPFGDLAARHAQDRSVLLRRLAGTALSRLWSMPAGQMARWQRMYEAGLSVEDVAIQCGSAVAQVRLALEGVPALGDRSDASLIARTQPLWRRGLSERAIAAALGVSRARLGSAADAVPGAFEPPRWTTSTITDVLGWSTDNIYSRLRSGTFPIPDGYEGAQRW